MCEHKLVNMSFKGTTLAYKRELECQQRSCPEIYNETQIYIKSMYFFYIYMYIQFFEKV